MECSHQVEAAGVVVTTLTGVVVVVVVVQSSQVLSVEPALATAAADKIVTAFMLDGVRCWYTSTGCLIGHERREANVFRA